jgi:carbon-monoxide dehydrogenase iron sulfur subunit
VAKAIMIDYEKCVGCKSCEQACSIKHTGISSPLLSRIESVRLDIGVSNCPIVCPHCQSPLCMAVCPVGAIYRDESLDRVMIDYDKCIGCRMCVAACPFGCMSFDVAEKKIFKCDLCDGDPICVAFCQHDALKFVEAEEHSTIKRTATAEKFTEVMSRIMAAMRTVE